MGDSAEMSLVFQFHKRNERPLERFNTSQQIMHEMFVS